MITRARLRAHPEVSTADSGLMWRPIRRPTVDSMTETTSQDLLRHEIRDPFDPRTRHRVDHDRVVQRAGDAERTATCEALAEHFVSGRLSRDELETRLGWAMRAVTEDELRQLIADLPRTSTLTAVATPTPTPTPAVAGPTWPASIVLAVVALIVSVFVAGGMLLVLGAVNPLLFIGACLGGSAAFVAGGSACYLLRGRNPVERRDAVR